ncbi:diguanylate cyclase [Shewanella chilikensis]|uniref:diguanylate cyclase n=2 Tax=Shewanella chilikensis TaxID=558541 RepID=A0A6G7LVI6_9GAMM|nr:MULTISPECIES: tetratricopeptide repeat-containing diguanylate cyclase [Shewanella]MCA0949060.1 diguanylate cyclase [Shewanella chilikensis]MCE9852068.1 diguanylate cyclase [Shewanella chilikensis]MCL1156063.1 diguanylate cyclase [Shewanella chilikensis]MCL1163319.1 diguanylate cyclase [Shewanella chilikensis]QIJ05807.1 diguanylate cyclase [Shewanella chilikensis]
MKSAFALLLLSGMVPLALALDNPEADKLFKLLENGQVNNVAKVEQTLEQIAQLLADKDLDRQVRLRRARCWSYDTNNNAKVDAAIDYANTQVQMAENQAYPEALTDFRLCHGWYSQLKGNMEQAKADYDQALQQAYQLEDRRLIADARSMRGAMYSFQGNFALALEDLLTAQQLYEQLKLDYWSRYNLVDLATSFRRFGDPQSALNYYRQLEQAYRQGGHEEQAYIVNGEMAIALEELGDFEAAVTKFQQSYNYLKRQGMTIEAAGVSVNMAGSLLKLDRIEDAKQALERAKPFVTEQQGGFYSFMQLYSADVLLRQGQAEQAMVPLAKAEQSFRDISNDRGLAELYLLKSEIFAAQGLWQESTNVLKSYISLHSELDNKLQSYRTTEMRTRFNADRMAKENQRLLESERLKEQEVQILQQNRLLQLAVLILASIIIFIMAILAYKQTGKSRQFQKIAQTDHLTQLANRRYTYQRGEALFNQAKHSGIPMSVILFDADNFKDINDQFGHDGGDKVLQHLASVSQTLIREQDLLGRIGGEEFLLLLPETSREECLKIAERLRQTLAESSPEALAGESRVTISAGVATLNTELQFSELLKQADNALYRAKNKGRNRVESA